MLAVFRKLAGTWPARVFFVLLASSFVAWGVTDVARNIGANSNAVATVSGASITPGEFQFAFTRDLKEATAKLPDASQTPPALRQQVASLALQRLVYQKSLAADVAALHLATPDAALRDTIYAMPGFKGIDGKFDRRVLLQVLNNNQLTEQRFLDMMREEQTRTQLTDTIQNLGVPPDTLTGLAFTYLNESRTADMLVLRVANHPLPATPADTVLHRFWANHQENYSSPEYRHARMVVLSAATIGRSLPVTEAEIDAGYAMTKNQYEKPERRSIEVITAPNDTTAATLLAKWRHGASWADMEQAAKTANATAVTFDDIDRGGIPSADLAAAVFSAKAGDIAGPIKGPFGSQIMHLRSILPPTKTPLAEARAKIRTKISEQKAADLVDPKSQKLQDLFAGGATLDEVPTGLGAAAAAGTMDASGRTQDGTPAPIPASPTLAREIVGAVFKAKKGDAVQLVEGPDRGFYAISVDTITPPSVQPFDAVKTKVLADWQADTRRHETEMQAAQLLRQVQGGKPIMDVAGAAGLSVARSTPALRGHMAIDMPRDLPPVLFSLKLGEATMVQTQDGFMVATLAQIIKPDPAKAAAQFAQIRATLTKVMGDDFLTSYATAIRDGGKPTVNTALLNKLLEQTAE